MRRILLLTVCVVSALYAAAQIKEFTLPDGKVIKVDTSVFPNFQPDAVSAPQPAEYVARRKARAKQGKVQLPPYVYNGESQYFPPIFNQDGGSCGSAQNIAYMFTHEMACYRDLDASLPENQYPSHFTWLLTNQSRGPVDMAKATGIPTVTTYGGRTYSKLFGPQTHDDPDYGWMQGYDKWYSAMWNRNSHDISFAPTNTPEGRRELKEWLYNHSGDETMHCGGVAGIGVAMGGPTDAIPNTEANKAAGVNGKRYVKAWGETINHAVTICGYDDRIEFDLDGDGKIGEVEEDEVGAWIIANSWGDGWENKGFIYCPYKYCYAVGKDTYPWAPGAHIIRKDYRPLRTIKLLMDYSHRSELLLCAGVSENLNATTPDISITLAHFFNGGHTNGNKPAPEAPMLGRWVDGLHYEPMEFGYDLTDLTSSVDRTKPLKYFFIVKTPSNTIGSGHIYKASIINYEVSSEGVEIPFDAENVEIIKSNRETIISVVVPGEQIYPATNLCQNDGVLSWTAPLASGLKLVGYNIYEGDNQVAQLPAEQTQFAIEGEPNDIYTVKAVYEAGAYKLESAPTNSVVFTLPQHDTNRVVMLHQSGIIIPNAISEVLSEATIEFDILSTKNENFSHQIGPGWGTFLFHCSADNSISVGWANKTGTDRLNVYNALTSTSKWYHIAIVISGNKLSLYINGALRGSITSKQYSGLTNFGNLEFGKTGNNLWWNGGLDEIRVWKKAFTATELKRNMYTPIISPTLHPDLLVYISMDTMQVNGKTVLREWVGGKHATFHAMGTRNIVEDKGIFTNTNSMDPSLSIVESGTEFKAGVPFQLTANSSVGVSDMVWTVSGSDMPELYGVSPTFVLPKAGTYTISCTAQFASGEKKTEKTTVKVTKGDVPVAAFDILNDTLTAGNHFSFVNRSTGDGCSYVWSTPGAEVEESTGTNAVAIYHKVGTYSVTLTARNSFGSSSVTRQVTVCESAPDTRFKLSKTEIMIGDTIQLIDESRYNPFAWQWELDNGCRALLTDEQSPYIVPTAPGIYDVSLTTYNDMGENTLTRSQHLVVSNDNPGTSLNFTGVESLKIPCPFTERQTALTLEWWMRPQLYRGSVSLLGAAGTAYNLSTSVDDGGSLTVNLGVKKVESGKGYIVLNEWHHYAIVYNKGAVQFYRDARLYSAPATKLDSRVRDQVTITMGTEFNALKGQIDEVRLWASLFDEEKFMEYSNKPISDIQAAQADDALLLYYDFNQSGGDVIDRTSSACNAQRIGFGPDGDAWGSAIGVFTLDSKADMCGDVSADFLTNYKNPFVKASGTVNPNISSRYLRLAMKTSSSKWQDANAIVNGDIITGAHIDTYHNNDITIETEWNGFATPLLDYRFWQSVKLPAGKYTFSVTFGNYSDVQSSRLVVCKGDTMVSDAECEEKALAWCNLIDGKVAFTLDSETEVSLGIIVNITGKTGFNISAFKLECVTIEPITPVTPTGITDVVPEQPVYRGIYNTWGQRLYELQKGINIIDGKKILNK
ncbi:MAG: DUF5013 domain-containing protein [Bacteroidaceae bacterium]|nr:DUF5013 domain-containing protein [Bacteroidaceae bacterium]